VEALTFLHYMEVPVCRACTPAFQSSRAPRLVFRILEIPAFSMACFSIPGFRDSLSVSIPGFRDSGC
jgi:hypothetical protein